MKIIFVKDYKDLDVFGRYQEVLQGEPGILLDDVTGRIEVPQEGEPAIQLESVPQTYYTESRES